MKVLIAEDDFVSRKILKDTLAEYGECDIVVDGEEAVQAFRLAMSDGEPYELVLMDIMMPNTDGQEALKRIREIEKEAGIKGSSEVPVIMVTALSDPKAVFEAYYRGGATSYIVKPIDKQKLIDEIRKLGLIR